MILRFLICILCLGTIVGCTETGGLGNNGIHMITSGESNGIRTRHVDVVNALRAENGMGPVTLSARLTAAARTHARDMSVQKRAWHFGSDGTSPKDRAQRAGYAGSVLSENISESIDNDVQVFQSWLGTSVTRRVMLNPRASNIGIGWFQEPNGKLWWVQVFGAAGVAPLVSPGS